MNNKRSVKVIKLGMFVKLICFYDVVIPLRNLLGTLEYIYFFFF